MGLPAASWRLWVHHGGDGPHQARGRDGRHGPQTLGWPSRRPRSPPAAQPARPPTTPTIVCLRIVLVRMICPFLQPRPIGETFKSVVPNVRYSTVNPSLIGCYEPSVPYLA